MMHLLKKQLSLFEDTRSQKLHENLKNGTINKVLSDDKAFHEWYRFVLSFPPHLVRQYLDKFSLGKGDVLLDPFCGTGTTLIEAKLYGICGIGIEANPFAKFASAVKTNWKIDPDQLLNWAKELAISVKKELAEKGINDDIGHGQKIDFAHLKTLHPEAQKLLIKNSISPLPLHKSLVLFEKIKIFQNEAFYNHAVLALANSLVYKISNLKFGPEVGIGKIQNDAPVVSLWLNEVHKIVTDLKGVDGDFFPETGIYLSDSRQIDKMLEPQSVNAVITSPPYPNEKDYTRTTRLESVVLGFINNMTELRELKKSLVRSNTRGVYKSDIEDSVIDQFPEILGLAEQIERKRIELGKNSGFEKMYSKVTRLYFAGMYMHLLNLTKVLKPGAMLAYVVGDQASYFRILIRTGELISQLAKAIGYQVIGIDLFRTRFSTITGNQLREEVVNLKWPGKDDGKN